jgi:histidine triad (HIT) family protein
MKDDCIFCKIIQGKIPSQTVFKDEKITVFKDINPLAPVHYLIVPNQHIDSLDDVTVGDELSLGHIFTVARQLAEKDGLQSGYRLVMNTGAGAGQTVFHLHMHLLGGKPLTAKFS